MAADGARVAVARESESCDETESGEARTTERWISVVGHRGKPTQMFFDDTDPTAYRAFAQKVAGLARPSSDRESFFKTGGFTPAVSALDTPSLGGCTAKVVRLRAKGAAAAPKGDEDFEAYGLWLDVSKNGKRLAHLWLGAGEDSVARPAYQVHPVWLPARPGVAVDYQLTDLEGYQQPDEPRTVYLRARFAVLGEKALAACFVAPAAAPPTTPASEVVAPAAPVEGTAPAAAPDAPKP